MYELIFLSIEKKKRVYSFFLFCLYMHIVSYRSIIRLYDKTFLFVFINVKKMLLGLIFLCLIAAVGTQQPRPCKTPSQWEAKVRNNNWKIDAHLEALLSYDSISQRTRVLQKTRIGQTESYLDIITLYKSKTVFYIDMNTSKCSSMLFNEPWTDYGVDPNDKFLDEAYIGAPAFADANLLTTSWFVLFSVCHLFSPHIYVY